MATGDVTAKMAEVSVGEKDKAAEKEAIFQSRLSERLPYYAKRVELFEGYYTRELAKREAAQAANEAIKVIMPDGAERPAVKGFTTPYDIAAQISNNLAKKCVVAKVLYLTGSASLIMAAPSARETRSRPHSAEPVAPGKRQGQALAAMLCAVAVAADWWWRLAVTCGVG